MVFGYIRSGETISFFRRESSASVYTGGVRDVEGIAEEIRAGVPEVLAKWRDARESAAAEEFYPELTEGIGKILVVFTEFLQSPSPLENFSREGATRALIEEISGRQHEAGRDAVGVIEDYMALRRCVWSFVEERVDLSAFDGGEVSRFFVKLMQASDWATEAGLEAFDRIVQGRMESALGRAAATDLLTGLPDRDLFNRRLLPRALQEHERVALVIFDVAGFSETVATEGVAWAREALLRLADAVGEAAPGEAVRARFGDDEVCAVLPGMNIEDAYRLAEEVLERLAEGPEDVRADAGVAGYPEHGENAGELLSAAFKALSTAKRVGGSGIVVAR
ncbi:MAG: GGDEF domain protein [uncultured Rubrobacteraceae bacterium]|uniref:GGDEF domain protein n=1 Tax=uncultured Rubrobacteraceae bacterium TaxID=349277 RepID=A0A6J4PRR7_9ACTN|nr:MAG: GGDEF domain protein [uncultured Rubrobacteraceae bacterium]